MTLQVCKTSSSMIHSSVQLSQQAAAVRFVKTLQMLIKWQELGYTPVRNPFSIGLYAPLMSEALLYTSLLPLEIHLHEVKKETIISVTECVHHMAGDIQSNIVFLTPDIHKARLYKNVWRATKMRSCPVFCLNWFPWESVSLSVSAEVGIYTSDDVDSSQAVECTH